MLLVRSDTLPEGPSWAYELKLDGYRALGIKSYGVAHLRSRNNKSFDGKYPAIVQALARGPEYRNHCLWRASTLRSMGAARLTASTLYLRVYSPCLTVGFLCRNSGMQHFRTKVSLFGGPPMPLI
jgi:hypothetical protein